ncbi:hypothetical protein [Streptomyces avermitilis]|uniref:hypothetical protein n=1 Tax=Streptomyces avermitilis TaxID=33903 RepID=UPI0033A66D4B
MVAGDGSASARRVSARFLAAWASAGVKGGFAVVEVVEDQSLGQFEQGVAERVGAPWAEVAHGPLDHGGVCQEDLRRGRGGLAGAWLPGDQGSQGVAGEDEDAVADLGVLWKWFSVTTWCMK